MARRRFFVDRVNDGIAEIRGGEAHHLSRVLRAEAGQRYELSDNRSLYLAEVVHATPGCITFRILEALPASEPAVEVTLFAALIKFDRFEWLVEKATELGVAAIVPVNAARSDKGLFEAAEKRVERWRRIVREAGQQSRRVRLPAVADPQRLGAALADAPAPRYVLEEEPGATPLTRALPAGPPAGLSILAGPEGGWTAQERLQFAAAAWQPVSLGRRILRAETAAIGALAVLATAWPD